MKNKIFGLALLTVAAGYVIPTLASHDSEQLSKQALQKVIDNYLVNKGKMEDVTGIAAAVFLPEQKGADKGSIYSFYAGVSGRSPFNTPVNSSSLFEIGSITKSFVAAIILQLEGEGRLSIKDPVGKWLPQYPHWKDVTIEQLLNMTSGIPNYTASEAFGKKEDESNFKIQWTDTELLNFASPDKPLPPPPGNRFDYSNSNYILAALIIETVTGNSFAEELQKRIIKPYHLQNTFYPAGAEGQKVHEQIMPRMAHGYVYDTDKKALVDITDNNLSWAGGAGAIIADMPDVIHWVQHLYHGQLFRPEYRQKALKELKSVVSMETGKPIDNVSQKDPRGFGLGVGYYFDKATKNRFWVYEGSTLGYRVMYVWSECNNVTVAVALNSKAGEGNPDSKQGDGIPDLTLNLYKQVIATHPSYACTN
ncbi:serine hydrolase domain-containing protein [Legionella erythra]|uniref:D-alanyl-D-alanine carboxypeptidase n=1 Tax=Legionella erythra TaxID=448 RepID=A0A0W0TQN1_LEGER|nr:serine hydrolase domain-containing protein [Legionella erythra]KTC97790.1 D-alanyl-D-alanine carboxypeptidase [Legionella erythra]